MINLFEIGINFLETFIIFSFLTMYFGCKYNNWIKYVGFISGMLVTVGTLTFLNSISIYEGIYGLILILIYFLYSSLFLKGDVFTKIFISSFIDCIVSIINSVTLLGIRVILNISYEKLLYFSSARVVYILLAKILLMAVCILLLKYKFNSMARRKNIISVIILAFIAELSMTEIAQVMLVYDGLRKELFIISVAVVAIIILAYYIFFKIHYDAKLQANYLALKQKYEYDKVHAQEVTELYDKICGLKHDLSIYFTNALGYLDESPEKAKEYMQSIIHNQIEGSDKFIETDNKCFNAIVSTKLSVCEKERIFTQITVQNHSLNKLADDEIGIIFGNLFDNAIRASKNSREKTIELDVKVQGEYLSILMMNSIDKSVLDKNRTLTTTKENKAIHGFGTKNIKRIVDEHDGMVDYFEEDGYFGCHILML